MFRELMRKKQALPEAECVELLKNEKRGVLSVLGDDGYPYGAPIDFLYDETDGNLYFHSGKKGHRVDAMARCDKASFCVYDDGFRKEGDWALNIRSVIVFGRLRVIEDQERAIELCRRLCYKFTDDEAYIADEIRRAGPRTLVFALEPEHITGKLVNES